MIGCCAAGASPQPRRWLPVRSLRRKFSALRSHSVLRPAEQLHGFGLEIEFGRSRCLQDPWNGCLPVMSS